MRVVQFFVLSGTLISTLIGALSALALEPDYIYHGLTLKPLSLEEVLETVQPGHIVFVSEFHQTPSHHELQKQVIQLLTQKRLKVNVGIEHFSHLEQPALDAYLRGELSEDLLAKTVNLSGFAAWKEQLNLPLRSGGWSFGLNAPRWLTGKINTVGYELLGPLEKQILPPDFTLGSPNYLQRLLDIMGMIHPGPGFDKFFEAQSAWDDTSAWILSDLIKKDPQSVLVVLFGDFHVAFGGGLPDRFSKRSSAPWLSISQYCVDGLTPLQVEEESKPHSRYGKRADYVVPTLCNPQQ